MTQSTAIHIRRAQQTDAEALAQFNCNMAKETEQKNLPFETVLAGVSGLLNDERYGFYLVAEVENQVIASLMITTEWSDWRNGVFWWVQSVYVLKEFRRQGIYRQLYGTVKQLAAEAGTVCGLRLYVEKDNAIARSTYQSLGMTQTPYLMYEELTVKE